MIEELVDYEVNIVYRCNLEYMIFEVCKYIEFYVVFLYRKVTLDSLQILQFSFNLAF